MRCEGVAVGIRALREVREGPVSLVTVSERNGNAVLELNHPPLNIISMALMEDLREALSEVQASGCRGVLIQGAGNCFSAGADVGEHLPEKVGEMLPLFSRTVIDLMSLEIPAVAFVHGTTLGGGFELALACDCMVASEDATLGVPEITLGVFPPIAAALLPREVGSKRAMEMILAGGKISAATALDWGLVNRVGSIEVAEKFLQRISRYPRPALVAAKKSTRENFIDRLREADRIYLEEMMAHPEPVEGLKAFLERRDPAWKETP